MQSFIFSYTQYFDDVYQKKASYLNPSIKLVAIKDDIVIGLIWSLNKIRVNFVAVQIVKLDDLAYCCPDLPPNFERQQIGEKLLKAAENEVLKHGIHYLEAWTREDEFVHKWYYKNKFKKFIFYYHVTFSGDKVTMKEIIKDNNIQNSFAHYYGKDIETICSQLIKYYECFGLSKRILVT
ncbi:MAG: GNAT family N-acetyltransferase [Bacteriovorax sp.]|nr:GNAT family N-acetyltransferase [Bacteriovorax sp.]